MSPAQKTELLDQIVDIEEARVSCGKDADAFRSIGEAASELGLKPHVLRFWESKFDNIQPLKRPDGRRYYRPDDMDALRILQNLLHVQGLTIKGAQRALDERDVDCSSASVQSQSVGQLTSDPRDGARGLQQTVQHALEQGVFGAQASPSGAQSVDVRHRLETVLSDLTEMKRRLDAALVA